MLFNTFKLLLKTRYLLIKFEDNRNAGILVKKWKGNVTNIPFIIT